MAVSKIKSKKIKDYELVSVVGKGGMGEVYLAKHPTLKRFIILKKLSIRDKEASERFLQEAKVMLEFRHENIVQIYDHFKDGGSTFIAMEYVKGKALNDIIEENGKIPTELALFILYQLTLGLFHAHTKKVIHRDIKPHNVLISSEGDVKLTDFGIAKSSDDKKFSDITSPGTVIGTPAYMSPEQFEGTANITYQSDIYSLGVVFYEMLTGVRPFKNEFSPEVLNAIMKGKYTPATKIVKDLSGIARKILKKTFNPKTKGRYKTLFSVIKLLRKYFKKYNVYEIKDSIRRLLHNDKKIENYPFYKSFKRRQQRTLIFSIVFFSALVISAFSALFITTNRYYEWIASDKFGKVVVEFGSANLDINNILIGIDGKYERAVFKNKYKMISKKTKREIKKITLKNIGDIKLEKYQESNFSKAYYLAKGEHDFSVVSGSYKNSKRDLIQPRVMQRKNKRNPGFEKVFIPVFGLSPKDVIVYFRFWDSINNNLLFKFDYLPEKNVKFYSQDDESLLVFNNNRYYRLKDYIINKKRYNIEPFYSNNKYFFMVSNFKNSKILYEAKKFNIKFALDDRTVIIHTPLTPSPAKVKIKTNNPKSLPIFINNQKDGLVYKKSEYVFENYDEIRFSKIGAFYYGELLLPPGNITFRLLKDGKSLVKWLNSGEELSVELTVKNGKYIY